MPRNRFDQASRFVAHLDAEGFLGWLITDFARHLRFARWLPTPTNPPPGQPERIPDTIAVLVELARAVLPWLYLVEWQTEPDPDMFGRLLVELGQLWLKHRPDDLPGSRYQLAASVINLTGTRASLPASWEFVLPTPDGTACVLRVRERYLSEESASATLARVKRGELGRWILPLVVVMQGAGEDGNIQEWLDLARQEPDVRRRAELGTLAETLAELKEWYPTWVSVLKEWNVRESTSVLKWQREAVVAELQKSLRALLTKRFGTVPTEVAARIDTATEPDRLQAALLEVLSVTRPEEILA